MLSSIHMGGGVGVGVGVGVASADETEDEEIDECTEGLFAVVSGA